MTTTHSTLILALAAFCSPALADDRDPTISAKAPDEMSPVKYKIETVVKNVVVPWDIVFAPDGRMFFTERAGRVRVYKNNELVTEPMLTLKVWRQPAENGLLGMCLHPDFATNHFVYLAYGQQEEGKDVRVVRFTEKDDKLSDPKVILSGFPAGGNHAGCRIRFGPDKKLYITTGEMFQKDLAQDMKNLGGKILRVNDDGTIPSDNPFLSADDKAKGSRGEIWALGCRNPQGIDWQPGTSKLFEVEHGPSGEAGQAGDEFNQIEKGKNYGWPTIHHDQTKEGLESPLIQWSPTVAPSGAAFYTGSLFPELKNNFLVCTLAGNKLIRIELNGSKVVKQDCLVKGLGRLRTITIGPEGAIYFTTSNKDSRGTPAKEDDRILRLVPDKDESGK